MRVIAAALFVLLACSVAVAQEHACPSDMAEKRGHSPFGEFHSVMAPAWHGAWVEKNFDALFKAGPEFDKKFVAIAIMKPEFKHESRKAAFEANRTEFATLVKQYAEAAAKQDSAAVYEIMPELHDAFEMTAMQLLPIDFPQISGMLVTANLIADKHLPDNNADGITGSTETLVTKAATLDETAIPKDCASQKEALLKDVAVVKELVAKLKACCDNKDMDGYKTHLTDLQAKLKEINVTYLEA